MTGVCKPDVVVPIPHQNDCSYVRELSSNMNCELLSHFHGGLLHGGPRKTTRTVKIGGVLALGWAHTRDNMVQQVWFHCNQWYADGTVTLAYFTVYAVVECQ